VLQEGILYFFGGKNNDSYRATIVNCFHAITCVGYMYDIKQSRLKDEYKGLPGKELGELRKKGIDVSEEVFKPLFVYLGDTHYTIFEKELELFNYPVIIVECTFYCSETLDRANRDGHIHWSQLEPFVVSHPETIFVLIHFSLRYSEADIYQFFDSLTKREENPISLKNVVLFVGEHNEGKGME